MAAAVAARRHTDRFRTVAGRPRIGTCVPVYLHDHDAGGRTALAVFSCQRDHCFCRPPRLKEEQDGIFLPNLGMIYFTFSSPYFDNNFIQPQNSQLIANVDAMFITEYKEYRTNEILRSFTSAASKATLQATMYNSHSNSAPILGILSSVYTVASSNTDVRTWATLPKYIYVIRKNESETSKNNLIYTRIINGRITDNKTINLK